MTMTSMRWAVAPEDIPKPRRGVELWAVISRKLPAGRRNDQPVRYTRTRTRNGARHRY
ncbi:MULTISPECIES: hypothetical protein [Longispora]|uniref:Uncharacterized protein n=1 Tax=Longispora fulva TaxID=619741 RepID=A0A8J7GYL9_9ACTN|nr:hypothetical protein [Longispora fulva]MBG6141734.1 hypothetical protein [Longispora fulva]